MSKLKYLLSALCLAAILAALSGSDVAGPGQTDGRKTLLPAASRCLALADTPPAPVRQWYRNFSRYRGDGSCVQCSLGINATHRNNPPGETLLWDTLYGPAVLGPSDVSRVAAYCRERNIPIYNVTGDGTLKWAEYAADTGRGAAIWFGKMHFQTLMPYRDRESGVWYVCNNNSPQQVDQYSDADFRRIHATSGKWIVVIDGPAMPPPPLIRS